MLHHVLHGAYNFDDHSMHRAMKHHVEMPWLSSTARLGPDLTQWFGMSMHSAFTRPNRFTRTPNLWQQQGSIAPEKKKNKHLHIFQSKCPRTSAIYSMHRQTNQGWKRWRLLAWPNKTLYLKNQGDWAVDALLTYLRAGSWLGRSYQQSILWFFRRTKIHMSQRIPVPCEARPPVVQTSCLASWINIHPKKKSFLERTLPISENVAA